MEISSIFIETAKIEVTEHIQKDMNAVSKQINSFETKTKCRKIRVELWKLMLTRLWTEATICPFWYPRYYRQNGK